MKAFKLKKLLPGMKVKMLDRAVLIAAGYEEIIQIQMIS